MCNITILYTKCFIENTSAPSYSTASTPMFQNDIKMGQRTINDISKCKVTLATRMFSSKTFRRDWVGKLVRQLAMELNIGPLQLIF